MPPSDAGTDKGRADVCLILEGTYPYVRGGVSTWVHDLITRLPECRFSLIHIAPEPAACTERRYPLASNVVHLSDLFCRDPLPGEPDANALQRAARAQRQSHTGTHRAKRVLRAFRRLHLEEAADQDLLDDLGSGDLSIGAFLHGGASFDLTRELCQRLAPDASFIEFFWHFRSMHLPLVRLLAVPPPPAALYHSLCTGYAGILAAVWSRASGRPLLLTEHGIYTRERSMELDRAAWFHRAGEEDMREGRSEEAGGGTTSPALRRMWDRYFRTLAQCAYRRAWRIVSLSEASRQRQIADGAPEEKTRVIPNGIDLQVFRRRLAGRPHPAVEHRQLRVGFVGRLVPIKNVVAFIQACSLALRSADLDIRIIGPAEEDPAYADRCRRLVAGLGLTGTVRFYGPLPIERIYPEIDLLVLTSISEGQPLVILEANAAGIPVIATDVGSCRELIEGRDAADRQIGLSGIVTRLGAPEETAAAIVRLAREPLLRRQMGAAGRRRVATFYQLQACIERYRELYARGTWQGSAGASNG